jgi:hypothetical protein
MPAHNSAPPDSDEAPVQNGHVPATHAPLPSPKLDHDAPLPAPTRWLVDDDDIADRRARPHQLASDRRPGLYRLAARPCICDRPLVARAYWPHMPSFLHCMKCGRDVRR